jgi:hypothetical protein
MPRFRFTIRRMIAAVAIVAVIFWLTRLSRQYAGIADFHTKRAAEWRNAFVSSNLVFIIPTEELLKRVQWHDEMAAKYDRASRLPFLPIGPNPPEPKPERPSSMNLDIPRAHMAEKNR